MRRNSARGYLGLVGLLSVAVLILAARPAEASWQNNRPFTLAERQLLLIERMTNSAFLTALGIDASPRLRAIHWSRDRFDRVQKDLREGNPFIGLNPTTQPEILKRLDQSDSQWRRYDTIFADIMASRKVSAAQIAALAASHADVIDALKKTIDSYGYFIYGGRYHSILSSTINGTGRLRAGTQLVLRSLMMATYNEYGAQQRQDLAQATKEFEATINGLLDGDPERRLLPAATREIRGELSKVYEMWIDVRPILEQAAAGVAVTKKQIATVARAANDMAVPLTMALIMYLGV
jgi:hypothetical protein